VLKERGIEAPASAACPATLWDVYASDKAAQGHPVRATVSDMGPLLLARMLALNEIQQGVLQLVFKIADDNGLLLLDLKDLRAMLPERRRQREPVHDRVRQRQRGQHRCDPARPAADRGAGRRPLLSASRC
jgi:DNA helicase HerA-like ATPase